MIEEMLGKAADAFFDALCESPSVAIKINRRKAGSPAAAGYGDGEPVRWCESGIYLEQRPKFTLNPLLHAGVFYVQDASSMVYETLASQAMELTGHKGPVAALDLCAAPGGKSTSILNALPDGSLLVANEIVPARAKVLRENLIKWGYPEVIVTREDSTGLAAGGAQFDLVAVDAPCSGEGMMRKEPTAATQWSPRLIEQCTSLQREILRNAAAMLKPGGVLIYSTCTFNTVENEDNLAFAVEELGLEPCRAQLPDGTAIGTELKGDYPALRFMPHLTRGEGLFAAIFRKPGEYLPTADPGRVGKNIAGLTRPILDRIPTTTIKGRLEVPAPEWPLSTDFPADFPRVGLTEEEALSYLRHEALRLPAETPRGYVAVCFNGVPLGLVKNIGNRANNLYPTEWRIRHL